MTNWFNPATDNNIRIAMQITDPEEAAFWLMGVCIWAWYHEYQWMGQEFESRITETVRRNITIEANRRGESSAERCTRLFNL